MKLTVKSLRTLGIVALCGALAAPALAAKTIEDRLKPVGETCMAGDPCAAAAAAEDGAVERSGEDVYTSKCLTCHATGAAGAPKLGDAADWEARLAERGLDGLYNSAINGYQGMPAKGLCMDCSDDELKASVDYILENSQ